MSYINDALRKAQQEKDGRYSRYSGIISRLPGPRRGLGMRLIVLSVSMMLMLTSMFVWLATAERQGAPPAVRHETSERAIAATRSPVPPPVPETIPAQTGPAVVPETANAGTAPDAQTKMAKPAIGTKPAVSRETAVKTDKTVTGRSQALPTRPATATKQAKSGPPAGAANAAGMTPAKPPRDVAAIYREGLDAQRNGQTATAERLYRQALTVDARHVEAMNNLGVLYMTQGNHEQAATLFRRAIATKKDYVDPHYNLACLYAQRNDAANSIHHLKSAIALDRRVIDWARADADLQHMKGTEAFQRLVWNRE